MSGTSEHNRNEYGGMQVLTAHPTDLKIPLRTLDIETHLDGSSISHRQEEVGDETVPMPRNMAAQPTLPDSLITTKRFEGFCLTIGEWEGGYEKDPDDLHFIARRPQPDYAPAYVNLSVSDITRWRFCSHALKRYCSSPRWLSMSDERSHQAFPALDSVCDRLPDWPSSRTFHFADETTSQSVFIFIGFSVAGSIYGGLHLLAWDAPFPSPGDATTWRGSGVLIASSGILCGLLILTGAMGDKIADRLTSTSLESHNGLADCFWILVQYIIATLHMFWGLMLVSFVLLYIGARGYLVAESFIQLTHLPDSAYTLPSWSQYYPHIT
jgi:hypothetical protein